jgi:hypothetical protein
MAGSLIVADGETVSRVDPASGVRTVVSGGNSIGRGPAFTRPSSLAVEMTGNLVVADTNAVIRVNSTTGDRTVVSDANTGSGPTFQSLGGIGVEMGGTPVMVMTDEQFNESVVRVDPLSGARTPVSTCAQSILFPGAIAVEVTGQFVITTFFAEPPDLGFLGVASVRRVDPVSGGCTLVFVDNTAPFFVIVGNAIYSTYLTGLAVMVNADLVVADNRMAVGRVDPITGTRTVISDARIGTGPAFSGLSGITVEATGSLVVLDSGRAAVMRVNPTTGDRTILSDAFTGCGPLLTSFAPTSFFRAFSPSGISAQTGGIAVEATETLVVVDPFLRAVVRVDPLSGDRVILSK